MEIRFQHVLLVLRAIICGLIFVTNPVLSAAESDGDTIQATDLDTEFFELGIIVGVISIDDFTSEPVFGIGAKFHATEDLFLQFSYGQAHASLSTYETSQGQLLVDSDRDYRYLDFLVGYNVMAGEVFPRTNKAYLSALYVVAGVGNTEFGGEESFTLVAGVGYKVGINGGLVWSVEFKDHIYQSGLLRENETTHNIEISTGISFLF